MEVKLIGHTQPYAGNQIIGVDDVQDLIAYCAKVSNPQGQMNMESADRLLNYLIKHKHWSPFEMASATLEMETTRDIARQALRHRSFSFQEFSQRYANPQDMRNAFVTREARLQDTKNRQNSVELDFNNPAHQILALQWEDTQKEVIETAKKAYDWAIENGIAKEQARAVLPEGLTVSRMYANGTIRSWIHYVELRAANGTQKEHMDLARAVAEAIVKIFPMMDEFVNVE